MTKEIDITRKRPTPALVWDIVEMIEMPILFKNCKLNFSLGMQGKPYTHIVFIIE